MEALEAVLFAAGVPLMEADLARALEKPEVEISILLEDYQPQTVNRGFLLLREAEGWILVTRPEHAEAVSRALGARKREMSMAALEALSAIAYFEPIERSFVDRLRGVRSERSLALLEEEGLIEEAGRGSGPGRPVLWRTTEEFLRRFGVRTKDELPPLDPEILLQAQAAKGRPFEPEVPTPDGEDA